MRGASSFSGIIRVWFGCGAAGKRVPFGFLPYASAGDLTSRPPNIHDSRTMPLNAVIVVDKPAGWTSHDVVAKMRGILHERSIGHLGTLDPMATGVLPLLTGRMTRLAQFYTMADKAYEGTIRLGFATDTYDADGEPLGPIAPEVKVSLEEVRAASVGFVGSLCQSPPLISAKKIAGVPAYKLARRKQAVELRPVNVEIREFEVTGVDGDFVHFSCRVSSGTYVRSLAHELGMKLGMGAHLASLRRTESSEFSLAQAHALEEIAQGMAQERIATLLVHPRRLLPEMPCVTANAEAIGKIRHGRAVNLPEMSRSKWVKVFAGQ